MSEEDRKSRDQDAPDSDSSKVPSVSSSLLTIGGLLLWETGKKLAGALARKSAAAPATVEPPTGSSAYDERAQEALSPRESDRIVTPDSASRRRWGTLLGTLLCLIALGGGIGFLVVYWTGGRNEALGGFLAIFFAALALELVVNALLLATNKEAVEPRESMEAPAEERAALKEDFHCGKMDLQRRGLLKWMTAIGLGTVAASIISLLHSVMPDPAATLYAGVWKSGQRLMSLDGKPIKADSLALGGTTIVFPEDSIGSERSQTVLVRVNSQLLELPSGRANWAPSGNLAFSRICTHAGCPVGMYEKTAHLLMCPCHQSSFDVLRAAKPTGGPAARALPQLPLYVDVEGNLRAAGDFTYPPGPGFWGMPS